MKARKFLLIWFGPIVQYNDQKSSIAWFIIRLYKQQQKIATMSPTFPFLHPNFRHLHPSRNTKRKDQTIPSLIQRFIKISTNWFSLLCCRGKCKRIAFSLKRHSLVSLSRCKGAAHKNTRVLAVADRQVITG